MSVYSEASYSAISRTGHNSTGFEGIDWAASLVATVMALMPLTTYAFLG